MATFMRCIIQLVQAGISVVEKFASLLGWEVSFQGIIVAFCRLLSSTLLHMALWSLVFNVAHYNFHFWRLKLDCKIQLWDLL